MLRRITFLVLALTYLGNPMSGRAADLDPLLPDDSDFVASADISAMTASHFVKKYILPAVELSLEMDEVRAFTKWTGINILKDVNSVVLAGKGSPKDKNWLLAARGKFEDAKIHDAGNKLAREKPKELKIHDSGKMKIYEFIMSATAEHGEQSAFGVVASGSLILLSPSKEIVESAAKRAANRQEGKPKDALKKLVAEVDGKQPFWVAGLITDDLRAEIVKTGLFSKQRAEKLLSISGGFTVQDSVKGRLFLQMPDQQSAKDFRMSLDGMRGIIILALDNIEEIKALTPLLKDFVDLFKFTNTNSTVVIEVTMGEKFFEKMNTIDPKAIPKQGTPR